MTFLPSNACRLTLCQRNFGFLTMFGFNCTVMETWEIMLWYVWQWQKSNPPRRLFLKTLQVNSVGILQTAGTQVLCTVLSSAG